MKKFFEEFKAFALRGNVIDLSIGVLIGGAFSGLVTSFTDCFVTPLLNAVGNPGDGLGWAIQLPGKTAEGAQNAILVGDFVGAVINFIIMAFIIFMIMKSINALMNIGKKPEEPAPEEPKGPTQEELLAEIRDLLKNK